MNEKNEIRDGWYMLNWKVVNETAIWEEAPPHYLIYVKDGLFYVEGANFLGYEVTKEMILHEYFNYGDVVYVRDRDTREWEKAKYLNYSNERFSHMAVVDNCSTAWNYCISEAEWKEKEVPTKPDTTSELQNTPDINVEPPKFMMFTNTDKKKTKLILEKKNEKKAVRNGWYKIKSKEGLDKGQKLYDRLEEALPKHRIIEIVGDYWNGWPIPPEAILHEHFNHGDVVYVGDFNTKKWIKAKYHSYSNEIFSHLAEVAYSTLDWKYCISEAEWKEKYKEKPMEIQIIDDCSSITSIPIHDNEEVTIMRCGDSITYETEKINN